MSPVPVRRRVGPRRAVDAERRVLMGASGLEAGPGGFLGSGRASRGGRCRFYGGKKVGRQIWSCKQSIRCRSSGMIGFDVSLRCRDKSNSLPASDRLVTRSSRPISRADPLSSLLSSPYPCANSDSSCLQRLGPEALYLCPCIDALVRRASEVLLPQMRGCRPSSLVTTTITITQSGRPS